MMIKYVSALLLLGSFASVANAFSTGAGTCAAGEDKFPNKSQHDDKGNGEIADSGFLTVTLGTVNLDEGIVGEGVQFTPVGICTGENNLCQMCQGDCDDNYECEGALICWQRDTDEPVPGCFGLAVTERDYCTEDPFAPTAPPTPAPEPTAEPDETADPTPAPSSETEPDSEPGEPEAESTSEPTPEPEPEPTPEPIPEPEATDEPPSLVEFRQDGQCENNPNGVCVKCQGDCDDNFMCEGVLECFQRDFDEEVPGCTGQADSRVDYCYDPADENRRALQQSVVTIQAGRQYTLTIMSNAIPFSGFLFHLSGAEGQDLSGSFESLDDDTGLQVLESVSVGEGTLAVPGISAATCAAGVAGATHTNPNAKAAVSLLVEIDIEDAGEVNLEITVMVNKDEWYMTNYLLNVVDTSGDYTPPIMRPTDPPTVQPTSAPTITGYTPEPTMSPIPDPTVAESEPDEPTPSEPGERPGDLPSSAQTSLISSFAITFGIGACLILFY